ncbi:hypothetical protein AGLY_000598, partial [Aphis glycines]
INEFNFEVYVLFKKNYFLLISYRLSNNNKKKIGLVDTALLGAVWIIIIYIIAVLNLNPMIGYHFKWLVKKKVVYKQLNKSQNILKIKSCKENANLNNWINRCRYAISVVFLILIYKHKKFYDFSTSKLLANFRVFDRFPTIRTTHKKLCIKFSKFFGHLKIVLSTLQKQILIKIENFSVFELQAYKKIDLVKN